VFVVTVIWILMGGIFVLFAGKRMELKKFEETNNG
jgi:hypothetical protein